MRRQAYRNLGRNSGVRGFAVSPTSIQVWFEDGGGYEYNYDRPGRAHVEQMKRRADAGRGLATYINRHVRSSYARKL